MAMIFVRHGGSMENSQLTANRGVICVEGTIDYSPFAVALLNTLAGHFAGKDVDIDVYGGIGNRRSREELDPAISLPWASRTIENATDLLRWRVVSAWTSMRRAQTRL